ncbi:MAG: adenosine deaminase [Acidobacteria bacterium RIFCSPLOWO2_12_FULL_54_10]|nr:MAG: adenosine deaminase [Acidobacteria bacterium RIFCSPLOWO2_12_FULL_54_10]
MEQFIAQLPKAELHLHLEGCIAPDTLWKLAERHRTPLFQQGRGAADQLYQYADFSGFLQAFKTICQHLQTPDDYELVTQETLRQLAQQNVRYAEIIVSAGVMLWKGENVRHNFEGILSGYARARQETGIRVQWIFDAARQFGPEAAWTVAREAVALKEKGVVAFGIGGDERQLAASSFREVFDDARNNGLRLTAHAGETAGPESIWDALHEFHAERIGHGLTAIQDTSLVNHLAKEQIPLEVCLSSNLRTGVLADLSSHPLRRFLDKKLIISLNTDDPALFGTDLNREYLLAHQNFGLNSEELRNLAKASFQAAFLPSAEKSAYLASF